MFYLWACVCVITGQNISDTALSPGSAKHVKNGFYISISAVSTASEGEYVCVAVWEQGEVTTTYSLTVGEKYFTKDKKGGFISSDCSMISHWTFKKKNPIWV